MCARRELPFDKRAGRSTRRARLLPGVMGRAGYQLNDPVVELSIPTGEFDTSGSPLARQVSIMPAHLFTAAASVTVPLLDLSAWSGLFQSEASADASAEMLEVARQNVRVAVVQLWYQLAAQRAMVSAAERNLVTTQRSRDSAAARVEVGHAGQLELARGEAEVSRARQALAEAELLATLAARNLENLTGLTLTEGLAEFDDDLNAERPLTYFLTNMRQLPAMRGARHQARAASLARDGAWMGSCRPSARPASRAGPMRRFRQAGHVLRGHLRDVDV